MQVKGLLEESVALAVQQGGAEAQDSALQQAQVVAARLQEKHATEQLQLQQQQQQQMQEAALAQHALEEPPPE